ncbi:unnamed protein product, partial [Allacma fusca]
MQGVQLNWSSPEILQDWTLHIDCRKARWNKNLRRVEFKESLVWKLLWLFHNAFYISYQVFVWFRWFQQMKAGAQMTSPRVMGTLYIACSYTVIPIVQYGILKSYGQHHIWINGYIHYVNDFRDRQVKKRTSWNDNFEVSEHWLVALNVTIVFLGLVFILDSMSVITGPDEPYFLTSLLHDPKSTELITILKILPIHLYIWVHQQAVLLFFFVAALGHITSVQYVLQNMQCSIKWNSPDDPFNAITVNSDCRVFAGEYRGLQRLQEFYNSLWGGVNV